MRLTAIDENGMGPQLGPLVVTALSISLPSYERARLRRLGRYAGIGDSKQVSAFGNMAWCESISLAVVEAVSGALPISANAFIDAVSLESCSGLKTLCPSTSLRQCWSEDVALPAWGGDVDQGRKVVRRIARWGVELERVRSSILCVRNFNQHFAELGSKTTIDLRQMQKLLEDASQTSPATQRHDAVCGMVGGIRRYPKFWHGGGDALEVIAETRKRCAYRCRGFDEVAFEVGADDRHMPVSLASMVGKYMRELWMLRQNRFYQGLDPNLPSASGYHDPVTRRHIEKSRVHRKRLRVADDCFLRVR